MQTQPRQQLLDIWQATARVSYRDGEWIRDGRNGGNSISDAEQLLCIMAPATQIPLFRLDRPDAVAGDVLDKLRLLGDNRQIPVRLIHALTAYIDRYTAPDGTPIFAGSGYFRSDVPDEEIKQAQLELDVVDSFSISVTLMLAITGFVKIFRQELARPALIELVDQLQEKASRRLSAAMTGLLRSFAVNVFAADSLFGHELIRTVNQRRRPVQQVVDELREALREINARLRDDVTIGSGAAEGSELDNPNRLFECGWSWGVVREAPEIETQARIGAQKPGVAQNAPYLYFTTVALDAIQELTSPRTRLLGLLDPEQLRLTQSLQLRYELTQSYWATVATFGGGKWPLEDMPWRTTDGIEADYFTLLVGGMVVQNMQAAGASDTDRRRVANVMEDLAARSRITRRSTEPETATAVHYPGMQFPLEGSEDVGGPTLAWTVADISPTLYRRTINLAQMLTDGPARSRMIGLSDDIWKHLSSRIITEGEDRGLWDRPAGAFPYLAKDDDGPGKVSWYYTKRVVDCLVAAARLIQEPSPPSDLLGRVADDLLNEAEYLYDRELLNGTTTRGMGLKVELDQIGLELRRARAVRPRRPGVAVALGQEVLGRLDRLSAARGADSGPA
jgi:hypothetical protein